MTVTTTAAALFATPAAATATGEICEGWMMVPRQPGEELALGPNSGFEEPSGSTQRVAGWCTEGPDHFGVDRDAGLAHDGRNNAYLVGWSTSQVNTLSQHMMVRPGETVEVSAHVATSPNVMWSYLGIRDRTTGADYAVRWIGAVGGREVDGVRYERVSVRFRPTQTHYTVFVRYHTPGGFSEILVDDLRSAIVG